MFKQTDTVTKQWYGKKNYSKSFSGASNSSDIKEEIVKQINMLKPFNMESCKAIPLLLEEVNNWRKN